MPVKNMISDIEIILTQKRWISDKILQEVAFGRELVCRWGLSRESISTLATTGEMWLKRKLGMRLDVEPGVKF